MGQFTITKDPTRPDVDALRVLMGPFSIYNAENVEEAAGKRSTLGNCSYSGRASRCAPAVCYRPCTPTTLPPGMWPSTSAPRGQVMVGKFDGERVSLLEAHRFPNTPCVSAMSCTGIFGTSSIRCSPGFEGQWLAASPLRSVSTAGDAITRSSRTTVHSWELLPLSRWPDDRHSGRRLRENPRSRDLRYYR